MDDCRAAIPDFQPRHSRESGNPDGLKPRLPSEIRHEQQTTNPFLLHGLVKRSREPTVRIVPLNRRNLKEHAESVQSPSQAPRRLGVGIAKEERCALNAAAKNLPLVGNPATVERGIQRFIANNLLLVDETGRKDLSRR